jgi:hypothetical protein
MLVVSLFKRCMIVLREPSEQDQVTQKAANLHLRNGEERGKTGLAIAQGVYYHSYKGNLSFPVSIGS